MYFRKQPWESLSEWCCGVSLGLQSVLPLSSWTDGDWWQRKEGALGLNPVPLADRSGFLLHFSFLAGFLITQDYRQTHFQKVQV